MVRRPLKIKLPRLFWRQPTVLEMVDVIHSYAEDLREFTRLRQEAAALADVEEFKRYSYIIEVAQKTLIELVELSHNVKK